MKALAKLTGNIFEQATYSGGRYLFWILVPLITPDAWGKIALLSLMNLFTMAIYGGIIGGPTFYKLVRGPVEGALISYLPCQVMLMALSFIGPAIYFIVWPADAKSNIELLGILFLLPWVSVASDWSRKTMILLNRSQVQVFRNLVFSFVWVAYIGIQFLGVLTVSFEGNALMFCLLTGLIYLPVQNSLRMTQFKKELAIEPFRVWRHYLFTGVVAYLFGNALFWVSSKNPDLVQFVILRNYLNPVLLLALYLETYGVVQMQHSLKKFRLIIYFILGLTIITISVSVFALTLIHFMGAEGLDINYNILAFVVITTYCIALIKVPTVYLRLYERENLVSLMYLVMLPVWPAIYYYGLTETLPFSGLEVFIALYIFLFLGLSALAYLYGRFLIR